MKLISYRKAFAALATAALIGALSSAAHADIAYNDFGAGNSYDTSNGWVISGATSGWGQEFDPAFSFTSGASGKLTTIDVAFSSYNGPSQTTFGLYTDNGSLNAPGTLLESFTASPTSGYPSGGAPVTLTSLGNVNLVAGQNYWLQATGDTAGIDAWYFNDQGATSVLYEGGANANYGSQTNAAFDVNVAAVPEASTVITFALLLVGGGLFLRRKRSIESV